MRNEKPLPLWFTFIFSILLCVWYFHNLNYSWQLGLTFSIVGSLIAVYKIYGSPIDWQTRPKAKWLEPFMYFLALGYPMILAGEYSTTFKETITATFTFCMLYVASKIWKSRGANLSDAIFVAVFPAILWGLAYRWFYTLAIPTAILFGWANYSSFENK